MTKASKNIKRKTIATVRSTGGAGFAFEDLVAADLLSRMLLDQAIEGIGVPAEELLSQAGAAGWAIDDLICVGRTADGTKHRMAVSCKSSVQVTNSGWPADFAKAAWSLWRTREPFNRATDAIALVTRGRNVSFDSVWSDLKQWCTNADPEQALPRIDASKTHRRVFDSLRDPGTLHGVVPTDKETMALIGSLQIHPLDFQLSPSNSLTDAKHRCRVALSSESAEEAEILWSALAKTAETARTGNGLIRLSDVVKDLAPRFALKAHPSIAASWRQLNDMTLDVRSGIEVALPNGHVAARAEVADLAQQLRSARGTFVVGDSGAGKSALMRRVLDEDFPSTGQIWLDPESLSGGLHAARRSMVRLDHDLAFILERSPARDHVLVLDSIERLDATSLVKLDALLQTIVADPRWRVVLVSQLSGFEDIIGALPVAAEWPRITLAGLADNAVRAALESVPALQWISADAEVLALLSNLRTLGWVITAAPSFKAVDRPTLTSTAAIADRLWARWTAGSAQSQLQRLLMRLSIREANFERSFPVSHLESGDLAAFDQRSPDLPLDVNSRNRIEFRHDLAADWARYQRLKEIADDPVQWSRLASQPLWIGGLRLFGQFLLAQQDQDRDGWDGAFANVTTAGSVEAGDLLLDALCLDPRLDLHLGDRLDLMFANDGALFKRLMHRFLHVATVPGIPAHLPVESGFRVHLEAEMRAPVPGRWGPLGRFFELHHERIGALGAAIVAKVCKIWLSTSAPVTEDQPVTLRATMALVALETARSRQIAGCASRFGRSGGDDDKLVFSTALAGARDFPDEVAAFALEMAERRPVVKSTQVQIDALRAAHRAEAAALAAKGPKRPRPVEDRPIRMSQDLPGWKHGPGQKIDGAFRDAVLHGSALTPLMAILRTVAAEVLLACIIEGNPKREYGRRVRMDVPLGLEFDRPSYPTMFWKSPFFTFLHLQTSEALAALGVLVDFAMERWSEEVAAGSPVPSIILDMPSGKTRTFPGTAWHFNWSQNNSSSDGQLYCALDSLERWLVLKAEEDDLDQWCERAIALEGSTAILGVLVNLGKQRPGLFKGPLLPLVGIEALYIWDRHRVRGTSLGFDAFTWNRQGEVVAQMARGWVHAPHRTVELQNVIGDLCAADTQFAAHVMALAKTWPVPEEPKEQLEQRILQSRFDPANYQEVINEASGETVTRLILPIALQQDLAAYQAQANAQLEPVTLPYQCERILTGSDDLDDASARYLATILRESGAALVQENEFLPMAAAAAAALIARGETWVVQNPDVYENAEATILAVIARADAAGCGENHHYQDALRFAAIGALYAALASSEPEQWNRPLLTVLTASGDNALSTLMGHAHRERGSLGPAWYRLNFLLILYAGLVRLSPRYDDDDLEPTWQRWRERLRGQSVFARPASFHIVDPAKIARRVERLLERRRARNAPDHPARLTGKSRRFVGLDAHVLELGFAWLVDHEKAIEAASDPENRDLVQKLWDFEAWRMQGDGEEDPFDADGDGEYDLPSHMGYAILQIAAPFIMATTAGPSLVNPELPPLAQAILALGPNGHYAIEHFTGGWFLQLFKPLDADRFMTCWRAMLDQAFAANWTGARRWYRGRSMLRHLLGINAPIELSHPSPVRERLRELLPYYRRWAQEEMVKDEDEIEKFAHFLSTDAGAALRMEGVCWLDAALADCQRLAHRTTGSTIAELVDVILGQNARQLVAAPNTRDAVIAITARLVREQVPTAMGLQGRIAKLR